MLHKVTPVGEPGFSRKKLRAPSETRKTQRGKHTGIVTLEAGRAKTVLCNVEQLKKEKASYPQPESTEALDGGTTNNPGTRAAKKHQIDKSHGAVPRSPTSQRRFVAPNDERYKVKVPEGL